MLKIHFQNRKKNALDLKFPPKSAKKQLPDWYKKTPSYLDGDKKFRLLPDRTVNATIKKCLPFFDALGSGYLLSLSADILVESDKSEIPLLTWNAREQLVAEHAQSQLGDFEVPERYSFHPFKWVHNWQIKTPKNYSLLFTHPLNRPELPFFTLSGIVDTDSYNLPVQLPFLIEKDFNGVIEAGTPIAQVIPIKREKWISLNKKPDEQLAQEREKEFERNAFGFYRTKKYSKKNYE